MVSFLLILSFRTSQRDGTPGCCHRLEGSPILSQLNLPYGPYHWSWIKSSKIVSIGISFVESGYFNFHFSFVGHDSYLCSLPSFECHFVDIQNGRNHLKLFKKKEKQEMKIWNEVSYTLTHDMSTNSHISFLLVKTELCPSEYCLQIILLIQTCMLFLFMNFYVVSWSANWTMFLFFIETL